MFSLIARFLPVLNVLSSRLVNRWTSSYAILVVSGLSNLGILPESIVDKIEGLPPTQIITGCAIVLAIYTLFHLPKRRSKVEKLREEIEILKLEKELKDIKNININNK